MAADPAAEPAMPAVDTAQKPSRSEHANAIRFQLSAVSRSPGKL